MPTLGAQAHHRARGERTPLATMDDPIENRAYALWRAIRTGVVRTKGRQAYGPAERGVGDIRGYEVEVNVTVKARDLWPELAALSKQAQEVYVGEIRRFLRGSHNAICLSSPAPGERGRLPTWWIRDEWEKATAVPIFRTLELTTRERRLTPAEAGEDRAPGPIDVRHREEAQVATEESAAGLRARALAWVRQATEPVYQTEAVYGLRANNTDVGTALRSLVTAGQLFRRYESSEERPEEARGRLRYLYWPESPVPPRRTMLPVNVSRAMDLVAQLTRGEELRITWMPDVDKAEVREMVEAGLLEYLHDGEVVRQLVEARPGGTASPEETTPPTPEEVMPPATRKSPPPTPPPPPPLTPPLTPTQQHENNDLGAALAAVVEQHLDGLLASRIERALAEEREARRRLETELAEVRAVADKRAKALRAMLGDDL